MDTHTVELTDSQLYILLFAMDDYIKQNKELADTFSSMSKTRKHILEVNIPACEELVSILK